MTNTVTFTIPEGHSFETKINGQPIRYDVKAMHESWILRFIEKGIQRYANDMYSGTKGNTKFDLCMGVAKEANSGSPAPEKSIRKASLPDDQALAVKTAKADLLLAFRHASGVSKIADMQDDKAIAAFFSTSDSGTVWKDESVLAWIGKQKEAGKRDYLADAKASLALTEEIDLDF